MKKRMSCLALMLCLLLTACGGKKEPPQSQIPLLGGAAKLEEEKTLLQVDGREVPAWRYLYWLARTCDAILEEYERSGTELDWAAPAGSGTLADYAKAQALSDTVLYATVENWGETFGCMAEVPEDLLLELSAELGLNEVRAKELALVGVLYGQLYTLFCTEGSALAPEKEELTAYAEEHGWVTMDRILVAAGSDAEAARQTAADFFSKLNGSENQAETFATLQKMGADLSGVRTIRLGAGRLHATLEDALQALQEQQYSGILETEEGFSILRRLPTDTSAVMEPYFDEQLQKAAENAEIQCTQGYGSIDVAAFYHALQAARAEKGLELSKDSA